MNGFHCITLACFLTLSLASNATVLNSVDLARDNNNKDIANVTQQALHYLQFRLTENKRSSNPKPLAIVLDVDNGVLAHDKSSAIPYTRTLYAFAQHNNVDVFFISQHDDNTRNTTEKNLINAGFTRWAGLFMQVHDHVTARQKIVALGYDIVFSMSNQDNNLAGGFCDMTFKLPSSAIPPTEHS